MKFCESDIPPISTYQDLTIIRGDQINGGLKMPVMRELLTSIPNETVVYPADISGSGWKAIAIASEAVGKKLHLLITETDRQKLGTLQSIKNVTTQVVAGVKQQIDLTIESKKWALENGAHPIPIGGASSNFETVLSLYLKQIWHTHSLSTENEIWHAAGSGTTARALNAAFPKAKLGIANLCFPQLKIDSNITKIFNLPQKSHKTPPFPSNPDYDGRMWPVISNHASPGSIVINYA